VITTIYGHTTLDYGANYHFDCGVVCSHVEEGGLQCGLALGLERGVFGPDAEEGGLQPRIGAPE
jgi:hypothetical protein